MAAPAGPRHALRLALLAALAMIVSGTNPAIAAENGDPPAAGSEAVAPELIVPNGHPGSIATAAYSADGKWVVTVGSNHTAIVWNAASGRKLWQVDSPEDCAAVAFSLDGRWLVFGGGRGSVSVWNIGNRTKNRTVAAHVDAVTCVAFDKVGRRLLTASKDGSAAAWDVASGRKIQEFNAASPVTAALFTPDGSNVVRASEDGAVLVWDAASGKKTQTLNSPDPVEPQADAKQLSSTAARIRRQRARPPLRLAISSDGKQLTATPIGRKTVVWNLQTGEKDDEALAEPQRPANFPIFQDRLAWRSDGQQLVARDGTWYGGQPETVSLVDPTGNVSVQLRNHLGVPLAFSPDGTRIFVASENRMAVIETKPTPHDALSLPAKQVHFPASEAAFSRDGKVVAASGWTWAMAWNVDKGNLVASHDPQLNVSLNSSPDIRNLLDAGDEHAQPRDNDAAMAAARLVATRDDIRAHLDPNKAQTCDWFGDDGKLVALGHKDGSIVYWDARSREKVMTLLIADTGDWIAATPDGFFECSDGGRKLFSFHTGPGIEATSAEQLAGKFYRAGLLNSVLSGKRPN